jgi:hypothetical protein
MNDQVAMSPHLEVLADAIRPHMPAIRNTYVQRGRERERGEGEAERQGEIGRERQRDRKSI